MNNRIQLIEDAIQNKNACFAETGAIIVNTGKYTGRAVNDRFIVRNSTSESTIHWGPSNLEVSSDVGAKLLQGIKSLLESKKTYRMSGFVGGYPVQVTSTSSWHVVFADNMFRSTPVPGFEGEKPISIYHAPHNNLSDFGIKLNSEAAIVLNPADRTVCIVGTQYAGEIKKSGFTLANYLLPERGIFPMHAAANCLPDGSQTCVIFGLSGTGKTSLSADPNRSLIGDDEHMWSDKGVSNLEGGCYAKLIDLSLDKEPDIFRAVNQFGGLMENVGFNPESRKIDYADRSLTENTRGSYPLNHLTNIFPLDKIAESAHSIVFLTADAFGALPAVARLNPMQAQYHFLSGYTSKVAGTEMGIKEPKAAFSVCFGGPFMPRNPKTYAKLLAEKIEKFNASVWLLNTGWTGGPYGKGSRFPIAVSRKILESIQNGSLAKVATTKHPVFGFEVPKECPGLDSKWFNIPQGEAVAGLADRFKKNFEQFQAPELASGGPV